MFGREEVRPGKLDAVTIGTVCGKFSSFARSYWTERSCRPWRGEGRDGTDADGEALGLSAASGLRVLPPGGQGRALPRGQQSPGGGAHRRRRGGVEAEPGVAPRRAGGTGSDRWCAVREAGH